jgi:hypothetical protein
MKTQPQSQTSITASLGDEKAAIDKAGYAAANRHTINGLAR